MVYGASGGGLSGGGGNRVGAVANKWNQMHQNSNNQFQGRQALAQKSKTNSYSLSYHVTKLDYAGKLKTFDFHYNTCIKNL